MTPEHNAGMKTAIKGALAKKGPTGPHRAPPFGAKKKAMPKGAVPPMPATAAPASASAAPPLEAPPMAAPPPWRA